MAQAQAQVQGKIVQCIGAVVDVEFPRDQMPSVYDALKMDGTSNPDGVATPPIDNRPPRPELGYGADPHSFPRKDPRAQDQKGEFLKPNGRVINVCGNEPCAVRGFDPSP